MFVVEIIRVAILRSSVRDIICGLLVMRKMMQTGVAQGASARAGVQRGGEQGPRTGSRGRLGGVDRRKGKGVVAHSGRRGGARLGRGVIEGRERSRLGHAPDRIIWVVVFIRGEIWQRVMVVLKLVVILVLVLMEEGLAVDDCGTRTRVDGRRRGR